MNDILKQIREIGIVPVIKLDDPKDAVPLAAALCKGGIPCAEITFRTAAARASIKAITEAFPNMLVGAGTVLTTEQVDEAIEAGAKFIVSPGFNPKIVSYCIERGIPITPGCSNPSDIEQAIEFGLEVVKFFPAEAAGGIKMIKAMSAPYTGVKFMPTGGINAQNLNEYLAFDKVIACGGSWMVSESLIKEGRFDDISVLTAQAMEQMLGFEIAHIGINADDASSATGIAGAFGDLFGLAVKDGNSSLFAGSIIEVMKANGLGTKGHIAFKTNYLSRAVKYLERKGVRFNEATLKLDSFGNPMIIYLQDEIGGFAVHIVQKK
ncbi:MAG: bifunctional 4-hydroxy-2-oxoglutarate aldolase/2-dehydro-3-deoxy-phosphogluconate aldolase [Oscillospiraceae bacterium]|nr:bifunctional 4-hydroxy-2-oxoglutarate aldolase/2-dehydro-3-deoxy-phosphogluconate aldolase [Oscillospiraceae bacterium]